jgi:glycosyltransferase involved in cell wall biosynthesis
VEAAGILKQKRDNFVIQFVGDGPFRTAIEDMVKKNRLESHFEITGHIHFSEVRNYLINADIGIALYQPTPNNYFGLSNKIFEYIICELPVIYPHYKGCISYLKEIGGIHVNPTLSSDIARKIEYLITHPEVGEEMRRAERILAPKIVWESIETKLIDLYDTI